MWALGNVAGDSPRCRDLVLSHGALVPLLAQLNEHAKLSMLRNATWTLSNFCRGKPQPPFEQVMSFYLYWFIQLEIASFTVFLLIIFNGQVRPALPALERLIFSNDEEVLTDACWALSYLSDGPNDKIQAVIEARVCPTLVQLLLWVLVLLYLFIQVITLYLLSIKPITCVCHTDISHCSHVIQNLFIKVCNNHTFSSIFYRLEPKSL